MQGEDCYEAGVGEKSLVPVLSYFRGKMEIQPTGITDDKVDIKSLFPDSDGVDIPVPHSLLVTHIRGVWSVNSQSRLIPEQEMLSALRRVKGEYESDHLAAIKAAGLSEDFIRLTYHKCRDCASWMLDTIDPLGDRTWDVEVDGQIEIPPSMEVQLIQQKKMQMLDAVLQQAGQQGQVLDPQQVIYIIQSAEEEIKQLVMEEAKGVAEERCTNMEILIQSQLHEGGWDEAHKACIDDFSKLKACVLKGPLPKKIKALKYDDATKQYQVVDKIVPGYWRVSPFNAYPAPNALNPNDGPFIEIEPYSPSDLARLVGQPGYKEDALREILRRFTTGYHEITVVDADRQMLENEDLTGARSGVLGGKIDCINFWGPVQGKMLREWDMAGSEVPDEDTYYPVNAKMVENIIFLARLNPDPLGRTPYHSASYVKNNDSMWGESPADLMTDLQKICNATVRNMMTNVASSSSPVYEIDETRLAPGDDGDIYPGKKIMTTNKRMIEGPAIRMYQAELKAGELLLIYDKFKKEADDQVVPAFANSAGGGERAAGALAMRMSASGRNIKMAVDNFDTGVTIPAMTMQFTMNMLDPKIDESCKGTTRIVARSTKSQAAREQMAVRSNELLGLIAGNADLKRLAGDKGLAYILAECVKSRQMDVKQAIPNLSAIEKSPNPPLIGMQGGNTPPAPGAQTTDASGAPAGGIEFQRGATG
jgi:hypothetical protein